jgi:16S rRNA (guanine966-N2)-methyltransferase
LRIVAGRHRGRRLVAPAGLDVRPTSDRAREALFNILEHGLPPLRGCRFLDVFAGTGAVGLEALSRGAARAVFIETARPAQAAIRANIEGVRESARAGLHAADATRLGLSRDEFDIVFLDPPYRSGLLEPALRGLVDGGWLGPGARVVAEVAADDRPDLPPGLTLEDERRYGAARLLFLRYDPGVAQLQRCDAGCGSPR